MRLRGIVCLALTGALLFGVPAASARSAPNPSEVAGPASREAVPSPGGPGRWIVTLRAGHGLSEAARIAGAAAGTVGALYSHVLHGFLFEGSAAGAAALARNPAVRTVVADQHVAAVAETITPGIKRIRAEHPTALDAHELGYKGAGARIAILDTGIDLSHPDLSANIDGSLGINCISSGPPQDGHGHGTHVAGIAAAVGYNNIGVIGVAPSARLVAVKVLDDTGSGTWASVICGIDYVSGLNQDADPTNNVDVANMSLGDTGSIGSCTDGGLHEAICESVATGIVYTAAAGNSMTEASTFIPASYPEVITVSAMTDLDGEPGGLAGCQFIPALLGTYCDDSLAAFSNFGPIDVTAPGVQIYSTWKNHGYATESGTSMAAPHVAGVAALVKAVNHALTPAQVEALLEATGENPDGTAANGCGTTSQWPGDPDGVGEPLVNALRAAQASAGGGTTQPAVAITAPAADSTVSGTVTVTATASDADGIAAVEFLDDGTSLGTDATAPYSMNWDTTRRPDGVSHLTARATDGVGNSACAIRDVSVGVNRQGDWVGNYGVDGFAIGSWFGTTGDLLALPNATLTLEQGGRTVPWASPTTDARGLRDPAQPERRATTWWDNTQIRLRLDFPAAYSGTVNVYAVDWDSTSRRENVTVSTATSSASVNLTASFSAGAWMHFPVTVAAGGFVRVTVDKTAGVNAVVSGIFLGGAGTPPTPPPPPWDPGVQGNWVGTYGVDGYAIGGWYGSTGDLASLPYANLTVEQGGRTQWNTSTTDARALESPSTSERRATTYWDSAQIRLRLDFPSAYSGTLHVYAVDWDSTIRRENVTVTTASTTSAVTLGSSFDSGAWMQFPISVAAGGWVRVTVDRVAGVNAVVSGLLLGGAGTPPPVPPPPSPPYEPGVQGNWVGNYGGDGYVLGAWNGGTDLSSLPTETLTLEQGGRATWESPTTDVRALQSPDQSQRRATTWWTSSQLRLRLDFSASFSGTLSIYGVDWDSTIRRQNVTVSTATTTQTVNIDGSFSGGAWMHFPITVAGGGWARVTVDWVAGANAVVSGLFLDGTTPTAPGAPSLSATAGNGQAGLTWTAPPDGGSPITKYRLYRSTTSSSEAWVADLPTTPLSYTDSGLTNGTTYYYQLTAVNTVGESARSTERSATPAAPATAPSAPQGLAATVGKRAINLSWSAPLSNGGSAITAYRIYRGSSSGGEVFLVQTTNLSYKDTPLTSGTRYYYRVTAVNGVGESGYSNEISAVPR